MANLGPEHVHKYTVNVHKRTKFDESIFKHILPLVLSNGIQFNFMIGPYPARNEYPLDVIVCIVNRLQMCTYPFVISFG